jgi:uncharacterized protein YndB with AHSA1/START domain
MYQVEVVRIFSHPLERVFRRYTDHAGWSEWTGFGRVWLEKEGSPDRDGVGAVRAFASAPGLREEVTAFEPPARMEYRISRGGFPLTGHRGEVTFTKQGAATRVTWRVSFESRVPGLGAVMEVALGALFRRLLTQLGKDLDKHHPG